MLGYREIQVASLGEDQLSFGAAAPPRAVMASLMAVWRPGKRRLGGSLGGVTSSESLSESDSESAASVGRSALEGTVGSQSSSSSSSSSSPSGPLRLGEEAPLGPSSSARMMPSSRMYETNSGVSGMTRERMQHVRYLIPLAFAIGMGSGKH